jgi:TPR repeat protein
MLDAEAEYELGRRYFDGTGLSQSETEAIKWFRKAADQGLAQAQAAIGSIYLGREDYTNATMWLDRAAQQGDPTAQSNLAVCYYIGYGVGRDKKKALLLFHEAMKGGEVGAKYDFAQMLEAGEGRIRKNPQAAANLYLEAAEQGEPRAQAVIGLYMQAGNYFAKDLEGGAKWYLRAAKQGLALAQHNIGVCFQNGEGDRLKQLIHGDRLSYPSGCGHQMFI